MAGSIRQCALGVCLAIVSAVAAVEAATQFTEFVQAQQANQAAMREYTWKSRTELKLKGETKNVKLEQVRFDLDSRLQKTQIGGSGDNQSPARPALHPLGGVIKRRLATKKTERFKDLMEELDTLAAAYAHLSRDQLRAFAAGATVTKEQGSIRLFGRNVHQAADTMTVWIEPSSAAMRRVEVVTSLEDKPVTLTAEYRSLDNGLTYQARTVLRYPDKDIELTVESFEYQHVGTAR
jgi:hypothetical protein